ncbi:MAG: PEP-CTERM sorting domain-containing protein [Candidatus Solibacter sp.]
MNYRLVFSLVGLGFCLPYAEAAVITFDTVADGTVVNSMYSGVTFTNPIGGDIYARDQGSFAPSPPNVVSVVPPFGSGLPTQSVFAFFDALEGAVQAAFSTPQSVVSINASPVSPLEFLGNLVNRPFLEAYASNNTFLGRVLYAGPLPTTAAFTVGPTEILTFTSASNNIAYVRFSSQTSQSSIRTFGLFDNLTFTATAVPEPSSILLIATGIVAAVVRKKHGGTRDVSKG